MSNTLPPVAAAAGVPQTADPFRLPAATVVTGHFRTRAVQKADHRPPGERWA
jgi:hypothetical protein